MPTVTIRFRGQPITLSVGRLSSSKTMVARTRRGGIGRVYRVVHRVRARQRPPAPSWRQGQIGPEDIFARWQWIMRVMTRPDATLDHARRDQEIERLFAAIAAEADWTVRRPLPNDPDHRFTVEHRHSPIRLTGAYGGRNDTSCYAEISRADVVQQEPDAGDG